MLGLTSLENAPRKPHILRLRGAKHMHSNPLFSLKLSALFTMSFVTLLWLIKSIELLNGFELVTFGILPGKLSGLIGVPLAPLIHGSVEHLVANTLPVFVLGVCILHIYPRAALYALPVIYLLSGLGVWFFARPVYHIGASGLSYGLMFFIFIIGVLRRDRLSIAVSMLVFFLYGSMVWGILPQDPTISYEYHFFGAMTGAILAFIMKSHDPKIPEKKYDWEDANNEEEDPIIGDEWRQP